LAKKIFPKVDVPLQKRSKNITLKEELLKLDLESLLVKQEIKFGALIEKIKSCQDCQRNLLDKNAVPILDFSKKIISDYSPLVFFVGDFPRHGEQKGCFLEAQHELLLNMIKAMRLEKDEYYLSLVFKCAPCSPLSIDEMLKNCAAHIEQEINQLRPKVVISLGALATCSLLKQKKRLAEVHGQFLTIDTGLENPFHLVPLFHPEYLLINPKMKQTAWNDMKKVMNFIGR